MIYIPECRSRRALLFPSFLSIHPPFYFVFTSSFSFLLFFLEGVCFLRNSVHTSFSPCNRRELVSIYSLASRERERERERETPSTLSGHMSYAMLHSTDAQTRLARSRLGYTQLNIDFRPTEFRSFLLAHSLLFIHTCTYYTVATNRHKVKFDHHAQPRLCVRIVTANTNV